MAHSQQTTKDSLDENNHVSSVLSTRGEKTISDEEEHNDVDFKTPTTTSSTEFTTLTLNPASAHLSSASTPGSTVGETFEECSKGDKAEWACMKQGTKEKEREEHKQSATEENKEEEEEEEEGEEEEEEEGEGDDGVSAMKDAAKEEMVSSVQAIEGVLGLGDFLSSGFALALEEEEQDEDAPEEIELETGVTVTVIDDADIDNGQAKVTCCRKSMIIIAALFVLPIVNVFSSVLSFIISDSETETTTDSWGTTSFDPYFHCQLYPEDPLCWEWMDMVPGSTSTSHSPLGRRKKRSASLCDVLALTSVCVGIMTSVETKSLSSRVIPMKTEDGFEHMTSLSMFSFRRPPSKEKNKSAVNSSTQKTGNQSESLRASSNRIAGQNGHFQASREDAALENAPPLSSGQQMKLTLPFFPSSKNIFPSPTAKSLKLPLSETVLNKSEILVAYTTQPSSTSTKNKEKTARFSSRDVKGTTFRFETISFYVTRRVSQIQPKVTEVYEDGNTRMSNSRLKLSSIELVNPQAEEDKMNSHLNMSELSKAAMNRASARLEISSPVPPASKKHADDGMVSTATEQRTSTVTPSALLERKSTSTISESPEREHPDEHSNKFKASESATALRSLGHRKGLPRPDQQGVVPLSLLPAAGDRAPPAQLEEKRTDALIPPVTRTRPTTTCDLSALSKGTDTSCLPSAGQRTTPTPQHPRPSEAGRTTQLTGRRAKRAVSEDYTNYSDGPSQSAGAPSQNQVVVDTYQGIYSLSGILSGVAITVVNYRGTAVGGAVVSGLACVLAAFLPGSGTAAMVFLLGVLPGIGNNLLVTSVVVALMEYFRERPLRALSIQEASGYLATIVFFLAQTLLFPKIGVDSSSWASLLQYQAATYAIAIFAALTLTPLNLHMRDAPEESLRARMLNISGLAMLKSPLVYILAAIFFFTGLGADLPRSYIDVAGGDFFLFSQFLVLCMAAGALLGSLVSACVARCQPSLLLSLVLMAVWGTGMGGLTLTVQIIRDDFYYAIAYSAIFGLFYGLRKPLMYYIIPLTLGTDHLPLAVGLTSSSSGLGSLVADKSAEAILRDFGLVDGIFYLSGLALLASVAPCLVLLTLLSKTTRTTSVTDPSEEDPAPLEGGKYQGTAPGETENNYSVFTVNTEYAGQRQRMDQDVK